MSAEEFTSLIAEISFVLLAILSIVRAVRHPRITKIHTSAFFSLAGLIILVSWGRDLGWLPQENEPLTTLVQILLISLPYPLLRLAGDFTGIRMIARRAAEAALLVSTVAIAASGSPLPTWVVLFVVTYFVATTTYASWMFMHAAVTMRGVSQLRMSFAAAGSLSLALLILDVGVMTFVESSVLSALSNLTMLAAGVFYYIAFAMPQWLKRLVHTSHLERFIRLSVEAAPGIIRGDSTFEMLESAVAYAMGTPHARVALWDADMGELWSPTLGGRHPLLVNPHSTVPYRGFQEQRAIFSEDAGADDLDNAEIYDGMVLLTAPVTLDNHRYGMLTAFGGPPPFLHTDDLQLLQVMADQVAVILRDRELLQEVSAARAREETMKLMDDFFAAVAHDLKTPLTTILGQGQRLQRQIRRGQELDTDAIESIVQQAVHMRRLVEDLLDDARERGQYTGDVAPVDLHELLRDLAVHAPSGHHEIVVEGESAIAPVDEARMRQVFINLLENAVKYSPDGGRIVLRAQPVESFVCVSVSDQGIGIPPGDLETIFQRFSRGSREPDRRFSGLGLGLYTCRRIVEEHGGHIEVQSRPGEGSTFTVRVPSEVGAISRKGGYAEARSGD